MLTPELKAEFYKRCLIYEQVARDALVLLDGYSRGVGRDTLRFYTWRIKEEQSFTRKVESKGATGDEMWSQITDILGLRLICLFKSDLEILDAFINDKFDVQSRESKTTEEGYRSVHYVVTLKQADCAFSSGRLGYNYPFEIQCRTLLEDAWAGVSHPAYKTGSPPIDIDTNLELLSKYLSAADVHLEHVRDLYLRYRPLPEGIEMKNLEGADFSGQELHRVDFSGFNLRKANFKEATFIFSNLDDADFTGATLEKADLSYAKMRGTTLVSANLFGARLVYADLSRAVLNNAMLEKAMLTYSDLTDAKLWSAKMRYADLSFATLFGTSFKKTDLRNAHIIYSYYYESADFEGADLTNAEIVSREQPLQHQL